MACARRRKYPSHTSISFPDQPSSFQIDQSELTRLVNEKDFGSLRGKHGGPGGIAEALKTDLLEGISGEPDDVTRRQNAFGVNTFKRPAKGFFHFLLEAFKDLTHLILLVCAGLSPGLAIKESGLSEGWYSGGSSFFSVFLVIVVSAVCKYQQNRQFDKLDGTSGNILFDLIRKGQQQQVSRSKIVVGDVVLLKTDDQVPADGLYIYGQHLLVDELSMTGESDCLKKDDQNPILFFGTKVVDGRARMVVTGVGMNTKWAKMMSSINCGSSEQTPLQARLNELTSSISKVGLLINFLVLVVLLILYFTGKNRDANRKQEFVPGQTMGDNIMNSVGGKIAATVTIISVMIPEGSPIAVTLILAYSMKSLMGDGAMVRKLWACETMGSATTICIDKTGTLTENQMIVTKFWVGQDTAAENWCSSASKFVVDLIWDGVASNAEGSVYNAKPSSESVCRFSGSPTEKAILSWAFSQVSMDMGKIKKRCKLIQGEVFDSRKKTSGVLIMNIMDGTVHVHWKGVAQTILAMCSSFYNRSGMEKDLNKDKRKKFEQIIQGMEASGLRCIAFAHKKVCAEAIEERNYRNKIQEDSLTLLGLVGIKELCRPGVNCAVKAFQNAGVNIKMITADNEFTAKAIAKECGILRPEDDASNGAIVTGTGFRKIPREKRPEEVEKIRVMARSSSSDKLFMVQCLKQKGHVVAVIGDGMDNIPALKEAHIGVSMGIRGIEVAKESSDIVINSDNFFSVAEVLRWGRCIYDNIQKFIQFKLTVNIAALLINFVAATSSGDVPLTAIQLLWVNLIVDTLGAFALSTDLPTDLPTYQSTEQTKEVMNKPPVGWTEPLITNIMWRNLVGQAIYQVAVLLTLQVKGESIFRVDEVVNRTMIFNAFVLCQVFNEFNARKLARMNIFKGIHKNKLFLGIIFMTVALQVGMVEFLKRFMVTKRLSWGQWGACFGIVAASWPIAWVIKCIPVPHTPISQLIEKIIQRNSN
ncbi:hypothetical protein ACJRO7_029912 [Eucalyptus globulus]|uniref:Calcium-transporting ATPase n=1 Tax=Eucalyptus globulus TaxID=34317 RepID=A0ABD3JCK9_EUCGL